jgi:hypothetical protein
MGRTFSRDIGWVLLAGVLAGVVVFLLDLNALGAAIVTGVIVAVAIFALEMRPRS